MNKNRFLHLIFNDSYSIIVSKLLKYFNTATYNKKSQKKMIALKLSRKQRKKMQSKIKLYHKGHKTLRLVCG